jgi:hypothetical protein
MQHYLNNVTDLAGNRVVGAIASVTNLNATPAAIYADAAGTISLGYQTTTDSSGQFSFYVKPGHYNITVSGSGLTTYTLSDVPIVGDIPMFNVKDFGAVGNNIADDTVAIQSAITAAAQFTRGTVFFPAGIYKTTSTLFIEKDNVSLSGINRASAWITPASDFGDVIWIRPTGAAVNIQGVSVSGLTIYTGSNTTAGAAIHAERCISCDFSNLALLERFGGLWVESCVHCYFSNINMLADQLWSSLHANSYLLKVSKKSGSLQPSELHFTNCDWRGNAGNNYLQYAVLINDVDGIWFNDLHCGFCSDSAFAVLPQSNTATCTGIYINNLYVDTTTQYGLIVNEWSSSATGKCSVTINGFVGYNMNESVRLNHRKASLSITNANIYDVNTGIALYKGESTSISNANILDVNKSLSGNGYGILIGALCNDVKINNIGIKAFARVVPIGIVIQSGATGILVNGAYFEQNTQKISDGSTTKKKLFTGIVDGSASAIPAITAAPVTGSVIFEPTSNVFNVSGTDNMGMVSAESAWYGREVTLIAMGSFTVLNVNNLRLTGNYTMTANKALVLICDGTNWFEKSRT